MWLFRETAIGGVSPEAETVLFLRAGSSEFCERNASPGYLTPKAIPQSLSEYDGLAPSYSILNYRGKCPVPAKCVLRNRPSIGVRSAR